MFISILYYGISTIFFLYFILDIAWRIWKRKYSFIPSVPNYPWIGSIPFMSGNAHEVYKLRKFYDDKNGHLSVGWVGFVPVIRTGRVEYIEYLLKSQELLTKSFFYDMMAEWLGYGLLISTNKKWKKRRVELTGAFHFSVLNNFIDIYEYHAKNLVLKLGSLSKDGNAIEVQWLTSLVLLDVICETSMGVHMNFLDKSDSEYVRAVRDVKTLLLKRFSNPLFFSKTLYQYTKNGKRYYNCLKVLHDFTNNVIKENIASRQLISADGGREEYSSNQSYHERKRVFIDILLDLYDKGEIDLEGIREEVDTFMFEGHDTTTSALSWTLYEIGRQSEIQEKIHREVFESSLQDCPLIDKIRSMKYTECVMKESLRLHPPVSAYSRKLDKDIVLQGNTIPSGTILMVDAMSVHTNPDYWDNPSVFNPDRFVNDAKRNPFCYVPFSAGPRNCIGQKFALLEEKVFLYHILLNFEIKSVQSPEEIKIGVDLITYSVDGINIIFSPR